MRFPKKLHRKLIERTDNNSLRKLSSPHKLVDFSSNDYLGFSKSKEIFEKSHQYLTDHKLQQNGSTGSRLLSGNHELHERVERQLASFFRTDSALLFNSGYDANIGLFSSIPQKGDLVLYDEYIHASIRDGIQMSNAKSYKFKHNDLEALEKLMLRHSKPDTVQSRNSEESYQEVYVVTESVFSMDGDSPDIASMAHMVKKHKAQLIVDEAHATGVIGNHGEGLIVHLGLEKEVFARVHTFGKAMGCHGAVIVGSETLKQYLINFARSFIYTTAIPLHSVVTIKMTFEKMVTERSRSEQSQITKLKSNIQYFNQQLSTFTQSGVEGNNQQLNFIESDSPIHCCIISGNEKVKIIAQKLQEKGFDVKPILSPTVPVNQERLRICLHSYNSKQEIDEILKLLGTFTS